MSKQDYLKTVQKGFQLGSLNYDDNSNYAWSNHGLVNVGKDAPRGIQVFSRTALMNRVGRGKDGQLLSWGVGETQIFMGLSQRIELFKVCSPVFGLVTARMNRISGAKYSIVPDKRNEDKIADELKTLYQYFNEYDNPEDPTHHLVKQNSVRMIKKYLVDVKPDLTNFNQSLIRWSKKMSSEKQDEAQELMDWLEHPTKGVTWEGYVKKFVFDSMIHGQVATYKQTQNNRLENFDTLAGGTIHKMKNPFFGGIDGHMQIVDGFEPQVYFGDEISVVDPYPISGLYTPTVPLEALINQVSEFLLFNELMAKEADGTKPPEKLVIITNNTNSFDNPEKDGEVKMDKDEQKRIEEKLNNPKKNAIMTFSGNNATVVDLTRADTMGNQMARQKDIRMDVANVFNASNIEMNLAGSEFTSGRENSETQVEMEQGKGIIPIMAMIENQMNRDIIPFRNGGYRLEFDRGRNEIEQRKLDLLKLQTGELTQNELREEKNKSVFDGDEYNKPQSAQPQEMGSEQNPMMTQQL